MLTQAFVGSILIGTALCLSIATSALADDDRSHRQRAHHRKHLHRGHAHQPAPHARPHHIPLHHTPPRPVHHHHHIHRHWPHPGVQIGVSLGWPRHAPAYPHGHHRHVHGPLCPVVVEKHVHHHVYAAPVWEVHYAPLHTPYASTFLLLDISPGHAQLYVDGQYLGHANTFQNGRMQIPVSPGIYMIQLHLHGKAYSKEVHIQPGRSTIVTARLM